jgi:hypothetical protein
MAIAFVRVRFLNVSRNGGACKALSYLGRTSIQDERLERTFDYTDAPRDLVYEDLVLPDGAPFATLAELANALDEAERRRQRRSTNRERWPQFGAHLIIAVPPDPVLTLDEVVELVERVVRLAVGGSSSLAVYIVIHDPALESPGAVTRHAHVLLGLREVEGTGLSRNKIRHLFAQARHAAAPNAHRSYVAEALSWPDIARDLQSTLFAEITSDAVVDPPAPFPGRHWSAKTLRHSPERRTRHDQSVDRRNFELINGDPAELVARMLRGRSVMRIDEVRRLLARFLDGADELEQRLDAILTDPAITTLANDPTESRPRWLTTKAVYDLMRKAVAIVDRTATQPNVSGPSAPATLAVAVGSADTAVMRQLVQGLADSPRPIHRPLILGRKHSDCRAIAAEIGRTDPIVGTFAGLGGSPVRNRPGRTGRIGLRRGGSVIVPHAETVDDQDLAALLLRAERHGARLLLGYDVSRASASCSLAAQLADAVGDRISIDAEDIAAGLRAGLVDRACRAFYRSGKIRFDVADRTARAEAEFVVFNDLKRLASMDREIQEARSSYEEAGAMLAVEATRGPLVLQRGQWIVYTANDYTTEHIRAGRFAKFVDACSPDLLEVIHPNGVGATLDLRLFPHVRSAHAITIREARQAPKDASLLIEVTTPHHAWSAALLAADRVEQAVIHVDPSVAKNLNEWIVAVARSKPVPLVTDLVLRNDQTAELNVLMRRIYLGSPRTEPKVEKHPSNDDLRFEDWIELMSDLAKGTSEEARYALPDAANPQAAVRETSTNSVAVTTPQPDVLSDEQRWRLHDDLRAVLYWNSNTRLALARLQSALAPTNPKRDAIAEKLLRVRSPDDPMATLVQVLLGQQERRRQAEFDELELPMEMTARMPRGWDIGKLSVFRTELVTMACSFTNWPLPLGPLAATNRTSPRKASSGYASTKGISGS